MKILSYSILSLFLAFVLLTGCQKPAPVELRDSSESEVSELQTISADSGFNHDPDTSGLIAERYFGELVVAGIRYDAPGGLHTVSLARGVFRDKTRPVIFNGRRVGYRTLDAGNLFIDGLPLYKMQRRIPGISPDTLVGSFYILSNRDGVGGRGFTYLDNHRYEWTNSASNIMIDVSTTSAKEIRVVNPVAGGLVSQLHGLLIEWIGGEEFIHLIVSIQQPDSSVRPIIKMKLRSNARRMLIPSKILQMLPVDGSSRFVFSFVSQTRSETTVSGYPDPVLVHSASIHNILLTVQR